MNQITSFLKKNWPHFAIIGLFIFITFSYFNLQFEGYGLKQHDIEQHRGMSNEISDYRERTGKETLWTNSMFGGMPSVQISLLYEGNYINKAVVGFVETLPPPAGIVLLYMLGFYIFALCMRINPWIGMLGAIAFAFATYEIEIIQAGHNSKALAAAFMPPVVGCFLMAYQRNLRWGIILSAIFMTIQLSMNHLQVSYYMGILLAFLGVALFYTAIRKKEFASFFKATAGIAVAYLIAVAINYGNITMTSDYAKYSIRGANDVTVLPDGTSDAKNATSGLDKDYVTQYSFGKGETFCLISPYIKGSAPGALGNTHFAEKVEEMDFTGEEVKELLERNAAYWGDQPIVSGPAYMGIVVVVLALIGLVLIGNPISWALFGFSVLALMLSWGENLNWLTNFFLDNVPGYNKFRAPTIIVLAIEVAVVILAMYFLDALIKQREKIVAKKKTFLIASAAILLVLLIVKIGGLGDDYQSKEEKRQLANLPQTFREQILKTPDPAAFQQQYGVDITNNEQLTQFINQQVDQVEQSKANIVTVRESIFNDSMNLTILFFILTAIALSLIFYTKIKTEYLLGVFLILVCADLIPVARNYLGTQEDQFGYKYWDIATNTTYPVSSTAADLEILDIETSVDPKLKKIVAEGEQEGERKASELGYFGKEKRRVIDTYKFRALNRNTNYRVYDYTGQFSSAHASYFHKSLGGYHGAKLRNIQNVYEYHMALQNNKVYDILNVKYFIQGTQEGGVSANPNMTALGNAWLVKEIKTYATPNDEIRALGNQFAVENIGMGTLLVNNYAQKDASVYGSEKLQYVLNKGKENDTLTVPLMNGMSEGLEAYFVMDINGKTNLIPKIAFDMDTAKSFLKLVSLKVVDEFKHKEEALMLNSIAKDLKSKKFSGEGSVKMTSYAPDKITYEAKTNGKQFAVFSEIYYPEGWTAKINGKEVPIRKTDYLLRGLELPSGKSKIEFSFNLPKYQKSAGYAKIGSFIIFLGLLGLLFVEWRKRKSQKVGGIQKND